MPKHDTPTVVSKKAKAHEDGPIVITIGMPCHDMCHSLWAYDLSGMLTYTMAMLGDRIAFRLVMMTNTYIQLARESIAETAIEAGSHYLLFVDSDMRFPKDALLRLLAHDKDVVGCNYSTRGMPPQFVCIASREIPEEHKNDPRSNRFPTFPESEGLEKCHAMGGGLQLIKAEVFTKLDRPWYHTVSTDHGTVIGEDVYFCRKLEEAGIDVWVDHDLSKQVGHIGNFIFETNHAADIWRLHEQEEANGADDLQRAESGD